jgi:CRP/FNR family transcriptional regulator, cyclic AMP receptor protein
MSMSGRASGNRALDAWDDSDLSALPGAVRDALLREAIVSAVPAGRLITTMEARDRFAVVMSGRVRAQLVATDGRTATIQYTGPGQVIGLHRVIAGSAPWTHHTITDTELLLLSGETLRHLAGVDGALAWFLATHLAQVSFDMTELLGANVFESVQQRVCQHLLELAENTPAGLLVRADQNEIAESIGSVREVVARSLRRLREAGVLERAGDGLILRDPAMVHRLAAGETDPALAERPASQD